METQNHISKNKTRRKSKKYKMSEIRPNIPFRMTNISSQAESRNKIQQHTYISSLMKNKVAQTSSAY